MAKRKRRVYSHKVELVRSSREAALAAIQTYNNPLITFKTETFIVLMIIAWTYLLHAYYRSTGIEYRRYEYKKGKVRRIFKRIDGQYKYWELAQCLKEKSCPLDRGTKNNLVFLIGLRNQIEHSRANELDTYLSGRYQACALNYNHYLRNLFGERYALDEHLAYSIQFAEMTFHQAEAIAEAGIPSRIRSYIAEFDDGLSEDEFNSDRYSYRILYTKKETGNRGQADRVIEFIDPKSDIAKDISRDFWALKEVEKPKFRATEVVEKARNAGFTSFTMYQHTQLWQREDAKNPAKGYGTPVYGYWYWYERWLDFVLEHLKTSAPESSQPT